MKIPLLYPVILGGLLGLTGGCLDLKPKSDPTRYFVLAPLPEPPAAARSDLSFGLRRIVLPEYLDKRWIAWRQDNEVVYAQFDEWAEGLNRGIQRVLAANLSTLLGTDQVRIDHWEPGAVRFDLSVAMEQFEVNREGQGTLVARWQIVGPDGAQLLYSARTRHTVQRPGAADNAQNAVALLSELLAEFSREIAGKLKELPLSSQGNDHF